MRASIAWLWLGAVVSLVGPNAHAQQQSPIGLRLSYQAWTPLTDNDVPTIVINDDDIISRRLNAEWDLRIGEIMSTLKETLEKPDLLAPGVTLYDVQLELQKPELVIDQLTGSASPSDPLRFGLHLNLNNVGMTARATTPDVAFGIGASRDLDPRCEIRFDARVNSGISITDDINSPLLSQYLIEGGPPIIEISRITLIGHNFGCSAPIVVANTAISLAGIREEFNELAATGMSILNNKLNGQVRALMAPVLADVNTQALGAFTDYRLKLSNQELSGNPQIDQPMREALLEVYDNALRYSSLQGWLVSEGPSRKLVLNVAPRGPLPDISRLPRMAINGNLKIERAFGAGETNPEVDCSKFPVVVKRKTGPRPMLNANGALGSEPLEDVMRNEVVVSCERRNIGSLNGRAGQSYSIKGLSPGFPNVVSFEGLPRCGPSAQVRQGIVVTPEGWGNPQKILPFDLVRSFPVSAQYVFEPCGANTRVNSRRMLDVSPVINPPVINLPNPSNVDTRPNPGEASGINPQPLPPRITRPNPGEASGINPQPLPPRITRPIPGEASGINPQPLPPR
jgi:hypothetical protein